MGNIGAAIARRGRLGFNMPILYSGNSRKTELEDQLGAQFRELDQLLAEVDFVCLVVPLSEKTRHLIGQRELALMKPSAILVNIRSEEHTSELQSLMRISYAVFCLKKKKKINTE